MKAKDLGILIVISFLILLGYGFRTSTEPLPSTKTRLADIPQALKTGIPLLGIGPELHPSVPVESTSGIVSAPFAEKNYIAFKEALGFKESRGYYSSVNTLGYMGKYQFGTATLSVLGIRDTIAFLRSPLLQEVVLKANIARNKWILRREIAQFSGLVIKGIPVTESGLIAAAHLAGPGNVKRYIRSGGNISVKDAYGTSIEDYMRLFAGYDLDLIEASRKVEVKGDHYNRVS